MTGSETVFLILAAPLIGAVLSPLLVRRLGRSTGYILAALFVAGGLIAATMAPRVIGGDPVEGSMPWIPSLGIRIALRLDALALLFVLLILFIGAIVLAYSARYFGRSGDSRTFSLLASFAAAMLLLVLADDVFVLFVAWELTSITSFFLIGGSGRQGKAPAVRAFVVTGIGGIALLGGTLLMSIAGGSTSLSALDPAVLGAHPWLPAIVALILVAVFTKSAQFPFHFWLPGAMVAPTPVSTYLHAATMVKAGIYLLMRLSPIFADLAIWRYPLIIVGLTTAVIGAATALRQYDLKALLAYSTVSQLGLITGLIGVGTVAALAAAAAHTLAHALYKASLFMIVGVIDKEAGSRDIRRLSGLRRMMPVTATITGLAALSMAGAPPFFGFVTKEESFITFLSAPGPGWVAPAATAAAVAASAMTFAYGTRIFEGAFAGPVRQRLYEPRASFLAPAAITAAAGLAFGGAVVLLDPFISRVAADALGASASVHFALWHGFTMALLLSLAAISGGGILYLIRHRLDRALGRLSPPSSGASLYDRASDAIVRLGAGVGRPFLSGRPSGHIGWILAALGFAAFGAWLVVDGTSAPPRPPTQGEDHAIAVLIALALFGAASARTRLAAVALLGTTGFLLAALYVVLGAPDLAITQLLIETLTVVLIVLIFKRLSPGFRRTSKRRRIIAVAAALTTGALATVTTVTWTGRTELSETGRYFLEAAPRDAGGKNVVNTILVDFRAMDTLGEITVIAVAAIGVAALVRAAREKDR